MKRFKCPCGLGIPEFGVFPFTRPFRASRQADRRWAATHAVFGSALHSDTELRVLVINMLARLKFNNKFVCSRQYVAFPQPFHRQSLINF